MTKINDPWNPSRSIELVFVTQNRTKFNSKFVSYVYFEPIYCSETGFLELRSAGRPDGMLRRAGLARPPQAPARPPEGAKSIGGVMVQPPDRGWGGVIINRWGLDSRPENDYNHNKYYWLAGKLSWNHE